MTIPAQSSARTLLQLLFRAFPLTFSFVLAVVLSQAVQAQTFTVLHDFTAGADGAGPRSAITVGPGGVLYGTAEIAGPHGTTGNGGTGRGCDYGCGTAFQLTPSGGSWQENVLVNFDFGLAEFAGGYYPYSPLVLDRAGNLYGTTIYSGNITLNGIVFKLAPSGGSSPPLCFTPSAHPANPTVA